MHRVDAGRREDGGGVGPLRGEELRHVDDGGVHRAAEADAAEILVGQHLGRPGAGGAGIAGGEPGALAFGEAGGGGVHAEGGEDFRRHPIVPGLACDLLERVAEQGDGEVGVFPARAGGIGLLGDLQQFHQAFDRREGLAAVPVGVGRVLAEAGGVGDEMAEGDEGGAGMAVRDLQLRHVGLHRVVEAQRAGVAELHEHGGGEQLGDGADGVDGVGRGGGAGGDVSLAEAVRPDRAIAPDHRDRQARRQVARHVGCDLGLQQAKGGLEFRIVLHVHRSVKTEVHCCTARSA